MQQLHTRSAYSLLESTVKIELLVKKAKEYGYTCCCLSDHRVMFNALNFYKLCIQEKVKPIISLEFECYIDEVQCSMQLIAKNNQGYLNLGKISYLLSLKQVSFYDIYPLFDQCFVIIYGEGGIFEQYLINNDLAMIKKTLLLFKEYLNFFYVAISLNNSAFWYEKNLVLKKICQELNIKTVALNKVYYLDKEDEEVYVVLNSIKNQTNVKDNKMYVSDYCYPTKEFLTNHYAIDDLNETELIVKNVNLELDQIKTSFIKYPIDKNISTTDYFIALCYAGLRKRLNNQLKEEYVQRLQYELKIIIKMHFEDYFLVVYDFINYSRKNNILVGPGRGSAASSLVSYCLGITHIDPIKANLLFERFLNPERVTMPDIDVDFPDDRRDEVIKYVAQKYGVDHVAHIVTFNTLKAKQVLRDVGKVLAIKPTEINNLCRLIKNSKLSLQGIYHENQRFRLMINQSKQLTKLFHLSLRLEGLPRHISTHAAGIVISQKPLSEVIPIYDIQSNIPLVQYTMNYLEELGLIKMDFLGLKNLSLIKDIIDDLPKEFDLYKISLNDSLTLKLLQAGDTVGIFQLESAGIKKLLRNMQVKSLADLAICIALYRPGPMDNINQFLFNRNNPDKIDYVHPSLKNILLETSGIMIYQEQIMQATQILANFSLAKADILRKAMSKKKANELEKLRNDFYKGCIRNKISEQQAQHIFTIIMKFAGYGFNKAHSYAYSLIAYQLAYLKANYPLQFYSNLLNNVLGSDNKINEYLIECRKRNIIILKPNINFSEEKFIFKENKLLVPLCAIKGLGFTIYQQINQERKKGLFKDFYDCIARLKAIGINNNIIEQLIYAGALDDFKINRKSMIASLIDVYNYADLIRIENAEQITLDFNLVSKPILTTVKEKTMERLEREKESLGFYLSNNPITFMKQKHEIKTDPLILIKNRKGYHNGFGVIKKLRPYRTKKGDMMAYGTISDESSDMEIVVLPYVYAEIHEIIQEGQYIIFNGNINDESACIIRKIRVIEGENNND